MCLTGACKSLKFCEYIETDLLTTQEVSETYPICKRALEELRAMTRENKKVEGPHFIFSGKQRPDGRYPKIMYPKIYVEHYLAKKCVTTLIRDDNVKSYTKSMEFQK